MHIIWDHILFFFNSTFLLNIFYEYLGFGIENHKILHTLAKNYILYLLFHLFYFTLIIFTLKKKIHNYILNLR